MQRGNRANFVTKVLCMSSSFWLLGVESRDFSQAENERTACKAEQVSKMTTIFTQNGPRLSFWVKMVIILWICSALQAVISFSAWKKSRDSTRYSQNHAPKSCRAPISFQLDKMLWIMDLCVAVVAELRLLESKMKNSPRCYEMTTIFCP